jgi:hypothetical protein
MHHPQDATNHQTLFKNITHDEDATTSRRGFAGIHLFPPADEEQD